MTTRDEAAPALFYPIVPDIGWLKRIVPLGVRTVQLRIKDADPETVRDSIATALAHSKKAGCQLIVNDFWKEAIDLGADYIHLGQEDLATADVTAIKAAGIALGVSTHTEVVQSLEIAGGAWMSLYDAEIANLHVSQMPVSQAPMVLFNPSRVAFGVA